MLCLAPSKLMAAVRASQQVAAGQSHSCPSQVLGGSDLQCRPFLVGPLHLVLFWTSFSPHAAWNWKHHSGLGVEWPSGLLAQLGSTSTGAPQAKQVFLFPLLGSALTAIEGSGASLNTEECCAGGGEDADGSRQTAGWPWWLSHKLGRQKTQTGLLCPWLHHYPPCGL